MANVTITPQTNEIHQIKPQNDNTQYYLKDDAARTALSLTQVDGVVTAISGSIAANTYDSYGSASTVQSTVIGASGDAASANTIYGAKAYADAAIANQIQSFVVDHVLILGL